MTRPIVYGAVVDEQTRCVHYQSALDVVAIKFKCCDKYYPCYQCHNEAEHHPIVRWPEDEFGAQAILCGECQTELTIADYMKAPRCSACGAAFNPRCSLHYHLYFEVPGETLCP